MNLSHEVQEAHLSCYRIKQVYVRLSCSRKKATGAEASVAIFVIRATSDLIMIDVT